MFQEDMIQEERWDIHLAVEHIQVAQEVGTDLVGLRSLVLVETGNQLKKYDYKYQATSRNKNFL